MNKVIALSLLVVLMGCATTSPDQAAACIHGDPGGSQACQAAAYLLAP